MKYTEYKNLCQGQRHHGNKQRNISINFVLFILAILFGIAILLTGCRAGYNAPRGTGYIISTPIHLIAEIPGEVLPAPYKIESNKKPKGKNSYHLSQYRRITNYTK